MVAVTVVIMYMCHKDSCSDEGGASGGHGHGDNDDAGGNSVMSKVVLEVEAMVVMVELEVMVSWLR